MIHDASALQNFCGANTNITRDEKRNYNIEIANSLDEFSLEKICLRVLGKI